MTMLRLLLTLALAYPTQTLACDGPMPRFDGSPEGGVSVSVGRIAGVIWLPRRIDGQPVPEDADLSLEISPEGRVTGTTGCNRFTGTVELDAGMLVFGPLAVTEMACLDPARMEREAAYLKALGEAYGFVVSPKGLWVLREDGSEAMCLG